MSKYKKVAIIGEGNFGKKIAKTLKKMGVDYEFVDTRRS